VPGPDRFAAAIGYIRQHPEAVEVILSGGDALLLPEDELLTLIRSLAAIPHVTAIRLASRLPAVLPQRLFPDFCARLSSAGPVWFMTQFNHPWEITPHSSRACRELVASGIPVMNQTVLLRGVNDESHTLAQLFTGLVAVGVKPYYLFHADPIAGTAHFRTAIDRGLSIMAELQQSLSGLALPRYAIDLPAGGGKVCLEPDHELGGDSSGRRLFRSFDGRDIWYV
jgi:lysine 2,3-aminomutase